MPAFKYRIRLPDGRMQTGIIEADDQAHAKEALIERGYEVVALEANTGVETTTKRIEDLLNRISPKDIFVATRTLSIMVSASVPLTDALRDISKQLENPRLRSIIASVASDIEGGARLSDALEHYAGIFTPFFINMVRSGETTGQLAEVLEYLADQQEKEYDLNSRVKGAFIYPTFVICTMLIVAFVMMTFVVPKLTLVLIEANVELPFSTRALIGISNIFQHYWYLVLLMVAAGIVGFRAWLVSPSGRISWDGIKMKIPLFGGLFRRVYVVRFSQALSTLLKGGMDLVNALEIVSSVMGNVVWKQALFETIREVNDGNSIVTAFQRYKFIPTMMLQMLLVGERTGSTTNVLDRLSHFYAREVDGLVENLTKLIEPIVIIFLGIGVAVLVSAILLPLYQLSSGAGIS